MTVSVNGENREIAQGMFLGELIASLGVRRDAVAVARNDEVVPRNLVDLTALTGGDTIEIIAAAAGG